MEQGQIPPPATPAMDGRIWYRDAAILISGGAFLFSLMTTGFSYYQAQQAEVRSLKAELRQIAQRITVLPRENVDAYVRLGADPQSFNNFSGQVAQETFLLANQASDILRELPPEQVRPTEQITVASALISSYSVNDGIKLLSQAVRNSADPQNKANALRVRANTYFSIDRIDLGRADFQAAVDVFEKEKGRYSAPVLAQTFIFSQLSWASAEMGGGYRDYALAHVEKARERLGNIPAGPLRDMMEKQIAQTESQLRMAEPMQADVESSFGAAPPR